jgi:hypothetical protein
MEQNFKKVEAKFKFSKNWIDVSEKEQTVDVDLIINYHNKTFSVTPNNQVAGKFTFCQGGDNSALMWIAILVTINQAIYFAQKELEFNNNNLLTN